MIAVTSMFFLMPVSRSRHKKVYMLHMHVSGIGVEESERVVESAQMACKEDVYHFDEIEQFFLVSCLALW